MAKILIFSRDSIFCANMAKAMHEIGHNVEIIGSMVQMLYSDATEYDVVVFDLVLSTEANGNLFEKFTENPNHPQIIIVTEASDPFLAKTAIISGAWDYFQKPPSLDRLKTSVQRAVEFSRKKKSKGPFILRRCGIVGSSPIMRSCMEIVAACAGNDSTVLIYGETGTGKELFARAIHYNSKRREFPFVIVDCAALPDNLVESILFGHEKGAFTTAEKKHAGLIKQAHRGTLFLDEVGELPLSIQKSFLRVLQERIFRPVGGIMEVFSDFRLIVATNKNLEEMAEKGLFRKDLLFRLQAFSMKLSPLRGRETDIKELVNHFLDKICKEHGQKQKGLSSEVIDAFVCYHWPGNVRELINTLEHAVISAKNDSTIYPEHLPVNLRVCITQKLMSDNKSTENSAPNSIFAQKAFPKLKDYRAQAQVRLEKQYLLDLLLASENDIPKACQLSGLSRPRLYALIKKYKIR
jgi:two-component system NtrC family response regulator